MLTECPPIFGPLALKQQTTNYTGTLAHCHTGTLAHCHTGTKTTTNYNLLVALTADRITAVTVHVSIWELIQDNRCHQVSVNVIKGHQVEVSKSTNSMVMKTHKFII